MIVDLTKDTIDKIFEDAEHQTDYVIGLFKAVYGEIWDNVKKFTDYTAVSEGTAHYIMKKAIDFDTKQKYRNVMKGGMWMNSGFSSDKSVPEWKCRLASSYVPLRVNKGDRVRIKSKGITVTGIVETAGNYRKRDGAGYDYALEVLSDRGEPHYWKSWRDFGRVEVLLEDE